MKKIRSKRKSDIYCVALLWKSRRIVVQIDTKMSKRASGADITSTRAQEI